MLPVSCPFCEHGNPEDARFCNACGGALHLAPCPRCGAVSDVAATTCYQCQSTLPGRKAETRDSKPSAADVSGTLTRGRSRVIAGTTFLAAAVVLGYLGYRYHLFIDATPPVAASWEAGGYGSQAGTGIAGRHTSPTDAAVLKDDDIVVPAHPAALPPSTPLTVPRRAVLVESTVGRRILESREARASATSAGDSLASASSRVAQERPFRPAECTESIAALGLCKLELVRSKDAVTAAAVKEPTAEFQATGAAMSGERESLRYEACSESAAALGLCTLTPAQRRQ